MEKRDPGRPKKKLREEDWRQKWYDAAESESYSSIGVCEAYEAAIINYHTADENSRAPILPKKIHATYTAERKFEVREFALANPKYSYQQIADAFKMPKQYLTSSIENPVESLPRVEAIRKVLDGDCHTHKKPKNSWSSGCWR